MNILERQYANSSAGNKHRLISSFRSYKMQQGDSLNQHFARLKAIRVTLQGLGVRQSEDFFQILLINSLPKEYGDKMYTWEVVHPDMEMRC